MALLVHVSEMLKEPIAMQVIMYANVVRPLRHVHPQKLVIALMGYVNVVRLVVVQETHKEHIVIQLIMSVSVLLL